MDNETTTTFSPSGMPTSSPTPNITNNGTNPYYPSDNDVIPLLVLSILLLLASLLVTHGLLHYFARKDTPLGLKALVGTAWFMGIAGVLVLLPLDLVSAFYGLGGEVINILWRIIYWVTFFLTWVICPVAMDYHVAGHFTFVSRLKEAVLTNVKKYALMGFILVVLGIALLLTTKISTSIVFALVNFYGMFLIVVMLGYGLVEVPMGLYRSADLTRSLESLEFRAGQLETAMIDAEDVVSDAVEAVAEFKSRLPRDETYLLSLCEDILQQAPPRRQRLLTATANTKLDLDTLAQLNKKLKNGLVHAERARYDWDALLEKTEKLEMLLRPDEEGLEASELSLPIRFRRSLKKCHIRHVAYLFLAGVCAINSFILLWCNVVSPFEQALSIYGLLIHSANTPVLVFFFSFLPLLYMATCVYTALFKFRYLDKLQLHGNRQTDAYNLLYNAVYMGRLQFSLGVVYFQMLYEADSHATAFRSLVGDMDTVPLLGTGFNTYSPLFILFFSAASFFSLGDRILDRLGVGTHRNPRKGNQEHEERIEEGRRLIATARSRRDRTRIQLQQGQTSTGGGDYARVSDLLDRF